MDPLPGKGVAQMDAQGDHSPLGSEQPPLHIRIRRDGDTIRVTGEIDLVSAPHLSRAVIEAFEGRPLLLDLTDVTFMDSSGLHALLKIAGDVDGQGPVSVLPSRQVLRIFEITRVSHVPGIHIRPLEEPGPDGQGRPTHRPAFPGAVGESTLRPASLTSRAEGHP
jgi:anti-anti-sigma factor